MSTDCPPLRSLSSWEAGWKGPEPQPGCSQDHQPLVVEEPLSPELAGMSREGMSLPLAPDPCYPGL